MTSAMTHGAQGNVTRVMKKRGIYIYIDIRHLADIFILSDLLMRQGMEAICTTKGQTRCVKVILFLFRMALWMAYIFVAVSVGIGVQSQWPSVGDSTTLN